MQSRNPAHRLLDLDAPALAEYLDEWLTALSEEEVLAVFDNPFCNSAICQRIARTNRLTSFYSVRVRLVTHRAAPQQEAMRFVHFLFWPDLLRISTNVQVSPVVRRAADARLLSQVEKMTAGEKITAAKSCSRDLVRRFLFDPDIRVFGSVLINARLTEDDLLRLASSERATAEKLVMVANDPRWSQRYAIRLALAMNASTPKAVAASQLRYLRKNDLAALAGSPQTSTYLRRCIEALSEA